MRVPHYLSLFLLGLFLILPGSANATRPQIYVPQGKAKHCKKHFKRVVLRQHHRKVIVCVKKKGKPIPPPAQTARVKLYAHIGPTHRRDPLNPFRVTYDYSATATKEPVDSASLGIQSVEPPSGVLALYNDGKLECAINVGDEIAGSSCPVTYKALGEHTVTTIYTSGTESATTTEVEQIDPLASHTSLGWSFSPTIYEGTQIPHGTWIAGTLTVTASVSPVGNPSVSFCEPGCVSVPGTALINNAPAQTNLTVLGKSPNKCGPAEPYTELDIVGENGLDHWDLVSDLDGAHDYLSASFSGIGYIPSATVSLLDLSGQQRPFVDPAVAPLGSCK